MEFWGVEVKPGESLKCSPEENKFLHLSQASLGELKGKDNVPLFVKINDQKLVIGTLNADKCAQISLDIVFEKEFELSHTSKNTSVHFCGYKSVMQEEQSGSEDDTESESEPENVPLGQNANGKTLVKQDQGKSGAGKATAGKEDGSASKKAKKAEPAKKAEQDKVDKPKTEEEDDDEDEDDDYEEDEDDDEDDLDSDEEMAELINEDDKDESSAEDDEATPQKAAAGKRPADSASKTAVPDKKAKVVTPAGGQKTGGAGKKEVHVATPYPVKKAGKTPANSDKSKQQTPANSDKSKQQTPKSASPATCDKCARKFNSDNALMAHTKAKHG